MEGGVHCIYEETDPQPKSDKLIFYNHVLCPYAERARLAAAAKQYDFMQCDIDLSKKPEWFFKLNPNGSVPTFQFPDGRSLYESDLLAEMMDTINADKGMKLLPDDPVERVRVKITGQTYTKFINFYYAIAFQGPNEERLEKLKAEFQKLDDFLADKKFMGGDSFNYADILVYPHLSRVMFFKGSPYDEEVYNAAKLADYKNVQAYYERVREMPEFKPVVCPPKAQHNLIKKKLAGKPAKLTLPVDLD